MRGQTAALAPPHRIGIVGSRSASRYGLDQAARFAGSLARAGYTIVSGMARGVDQAAHSGALDAGGTTIALLGNGVDRPWPHYYDLARLLDQGLLMSEFAPGQAPRRHHFPLRNRLIAALSDAVLVIEAAHASGSLITAHWGLELGKEVFALPGRVDHPMAAGTLRLLREGARAVGSPAELLSDLGWALEPTVTEATTPDQPKDEQALRLWDLLQGETLNVNELAARLQSPLPEVLARLSALQLSGHVAQSPGGLYRRTYPGASSTTPDQ